MKPKIIDLSWEIAIALDALSETEKQLVDYDSWGWDSGYELGLIRSIKDNLILFQKRPNLLFDPTELPFLKDISKRLDQFRSTDKFLFSADEYSFHQSYFVNAVASVYEIIESVSGVSEKIQLINNDINFTSNNIFLLGNAISDLILKLNKNPNEWFALGPRKFEEVLAEIWHKLGWETYLTPPVKDGGLDLRAVRTDNGIYLCYLIEAKAYNPKRPVGIEFVRNLYGVVERERATHGILATTSYFTKGAIEESRALKFRVSLADFEQVFKWAEEYKKLK